MKYFTLLLYCFMLTACTDQQHITKTKFKTLMLRSSGEVEALPNMASFSISLSCLKSNINSSKNCLVEKSNELTERLIGFGISKEDILTTAVNMRKSYSWVKNSSVFNGYSSSTNLYVTIKNIDNLDEVYTELLENRNLTISGLQYSHNQLDSLEHEAYLNALKNAETLGNKLLKQLPEKQLEILKVGNVQLSSSLPESIENDDYIMKDEMIELAQESKRYLAINKGTISVNATLFVEFQLK